MKKGDFIMKRSDIIRLTDAKVRVPYCVVSMQHSFKYKYRLRGLGITDCAQILVLCRKNNGDMIVKTRGIRLAINKECAEGIYVG